MSKRARDAKRARRRAGVQVIRTFRIQNATFEVTDEVHDISPEEMQRVIDSCLLSLRRFEERFFAPRLDRDLFGGILDGITDERPNTNTCSEVRAPSVAWPRSPMSLVRFDLT